MVAPAVRRPRVTDSPRAAGQDVIDLTVGVTGRPGPCASRAAPTGEEDAQGRTPRVEVPDEEGRSRGLGLLGDASDVTVGAKGAVTEVGTVDGDDPQGSVPVAQVRDDQPASHALAGLAR